MCGYYSELSCCHHPTGVGDTTEVSIFLIGLATCTLVPFIHSPWGCQSINLMMLDLVPIRLLTIIFCLSFWESSKGNVFSGFSRETEPTGYTHTHTHTHTRFVTRNRFMHYGRWSFPWSNRPWYNVYKERLASWTCNMRSCRESHAQKGTFGLTLCWWHLEMLNNFIWIYVL